MEKLNCAGAAEKLLGWNKILVLSHASPDGDTLGSATALIRGLSFLGKQASFACADPIPTRLQYLFEDLPLYEGEMEHVVAVDVADPQLLGGLREEYADRVDLVIDHHGSRKEYGKSQWVEEDSAAACELVYLLLKEMEIPLTPEMATALYTGLSTDTGCFRYRNVTPRTMSIAAEVMAAKARAGDVNQWMFETKTLGQMAAERLVMERMEFFCDGRCAMIAIPRSVYEKTGATEGDLEGAASLPRQIEGVVIGVTLKEKEDGAWKASVRTNPPADASVICGKFGGGGHVGAGGCALGALPLKEAAGKFRQVCETYLKELEG